MSTIKLKEVIPAPLDAVWTELADLPSHVHWMADAASLTFLDEQRAGIGTRFDCVTKVGPLKTTDRMIITDWRPRQAIGVRHVGTVNGEGTFSLRRSLRHPRTHTVVTWKETLRFPWYLGGPVGSLVVKPVLRFVWRRNLRRLATRVTSGSA